MNNLEKVVIDDIYDLVNKSARDQYSDGNTFAPGALRNNYFRGKNLNITATELADRCTDWLFDDLFIGDYIDLPIVYNGNNITPRFMIAAFNWYLKTGSPELTQPHICMVTRNVITMAQMNTTDTSTGGVLESPFIKQIMTDLNTSFQSAFNNRIINAVWMFDTSPTTKVRANATVRLCSLGEVYGCSSVDSHYGMMSGQLPIYRYNPVYRMGSGGHWRWFNDIANSNCFWCGSNAGHFSAMRASKSEGVFPIFLLG